MRQQQPQRPEAESIKYGDVFDVSGELASQTIAPRDASAMQAAEQMLLGNTQKDGPAAIMQSAAAENQRRGVVAPHDATNAAKNEGVAISEAQGGGLRFITESVGGQPIEKYVQQGAVHMPPGGGGTTGGDPITIGEALEATALSAGDKPIDKSDAAAIQAAEVRATGSDQIVRGGLAASAQSAATLNAKTTNDHDKTKLGDVLADASLKLPDQPVKDDDAERVISAEIRNDPDSAVHAGGVSTSMAAAAKLNQKY